MENIMNEIKKNNKVWIDRDIKAQIRAMIWDTLHLEIDSEGESVISESSVEHLLDDVHAEFDVAIRKNEKNEPCELYRCQSYFDDEGTLRDCTCGRCR